jgi:hypothetical protein
MLLESFATVSDCKFKIIEIPFERLTDIDENFLSLIQNRIIDGIIIKKFLLPEERLGVLDNLQKIPDERKFEIHGCGGFLFPITFNQLRPDNNYQNHKKSYFFESKNFREYFVGNFGFDIEYKIANMFSILSLGVKVKVAPGLENNTQMLPVTIRVFQPGRGGVLAHCHNTYDEDLHPEFVNHLSSLMKMKHQLSFFISVNKPNKGGEITLFNIEHNDANRKQGDYAIIRLDGSLFDTKIEQNKNKIQLDEGDLIIFAGGDIWHQVENIEGEKNRITIGGFGTFSLDNSIFYIWS